MAASIAVPDKLVVFAHGKESGPWGTKITRLAETARRRGFDVISPDYSHSVDARARLAQLLEQAPRAESALVLVGSSMGGYVSAMACAALHPQGLFLIAPALYFPGYDDTLPIPPAITTVVHGWQDDIVPVERAIRYAQCHRTTLHLLDSGHTVNDRLPELEQLFDDLLRRVSLLATYRKAGYRVDSDHGPISLHAGQRDPLAEAALIAACGIRTRWALVTACNPAGEQHADADNAARVAALRQRLRVDGIRHIPASGFDPRGEWPAETSELLCDPPPDYAETLAREFGQNAILRGTIGEAAEVVWLR